MALTIGSRLGHYDVTALIGEGGMSQVCRHRTRPRESGMMRLILSVLALLTTSTIGLAQPVEPYDVPRTPHGHPDFQGVWAIGFLYLLERPPGIDGLVATPEQADALAETIRTQLPDNVDPDVLRYNFRQLAQVKGEYRTSVIVDPADGRMPYTQTASDLATWILRRNEQMFDGPEQRPFNERCMENLGYPPIRAVPVFLPRQIFQTPDYVAILAEDAVGLRLIRLGGAPPPDALRSVGGHSTGHWEGDTLVVRTTHLRDDDPARNVIGRPLLLSRDSRITERFTRVSPTELFYQFTVEDDGLYRQPWRGEFSLTRHDVLIYEYACHEGNYSMPISLVGGQAQAAERADTDPDRN